MNQHSKHTVSAVICAAGSSVRMSGKVRKPYLKLLGKPILAWSLKALAPVKNLTEIVIVTKPEDCLMAQKIVSETKLPDHIKIIYVDGGLRRQDSVLNGIRATSADASIVLIHDAARPFPPLDAIERACVAAADPKLGSAILAIRVKDTVKKEHVELPSKATSTVPRAGLWLAQTPQVFRRTLILNFHDRLACEQPNFEITDDASICELYSHPVTLIESSNTNLKVTLPEDVAIAEALLKAGLV